MNRATKQERNIRLIPDADFILHVTSWLVQISNIREHFHLGLLLYHHRQAHLHRIGANCHTFSSTAEPFVYIFYSHASVSQSPFQLKQNLVAETKNIFMRDQYINILVCPHVHTPQQFEIFLSESKNAYI